jgi:hypothetical protein
MNAGIRMIIIVSTQHRMEHVETLLAHLYVAATLDILEMVLPRAKVPQLPHLINIQVFSCKDTRI